MVSFLFHADSAYMRMLKTALRLGCRAMQMADEFPDIEVTGADLAPIQPRSLAFSVIIFWSCALTPFICFRTEDLCP